MLRESIEVAGQQVDLSGLTDPECTRIEGIEHSEELIRFTDAYLGTDSQVLDQARQALADALGEVAMVDAAAIVANFQRMVRIADATGIPSDDAMLVMSEDLRGDLAINNYTARANSPTIGPVKRMLLKLVAVRMFHRASGVQ